MQILGISAFYHDSAACLLRDGRVVCAVEEERLSRLKHDRRFPRLAVEFCLERARTNIHDIDVVAFYEQPMRKMERQVWMAIRPEASDEIRKRAFQRLDPGHVERQIREVGCYEGEIDFVEHHEAHAASSYFYSGFPDAAIMTFDGVGEWATSSYGAAEGHQLRLFEEVHFPHSLGLLYSTITAYLGFTVNDGEYKVMGLAPYGSPHYVDQIQSLIALRQEGQYQLNLEYFDFLRTNRMYSDKLVSLFGHDARAPEAELEPFHKDVARSLQVVLEEILLQKARYLHARVPSDHLCMAGGVALNCVANGRVLRDGPFSDLFVHPAAGDAGGALGAAALVHARRTGVHPDQARLKEVFWGPSYSSADVAVLLGASAVRALDYRGRPDDFLDAVVDRLVEGKVVGWFDGAMEFGPRALGARSILGDPRVTDMRDRINALVKKLEAFRPFAPAVLESEASADFDIDHPSPFMLETCRVTSSLGLPAVTHVDGSARIQTVDRSLDSRYSRLLQRFHERTGCPVLLNTSFNVRGEPIVCSPEDALLCFARSKLDALALQDFIIDRSSLPRHWESAVQHIPIQPPAVSHEVYAML